MYLSYIDYIAWFFGFRRKYIICLFTSKKCKYAISNNGIKVIAKTNKEQREN